MASKNTKLPKKPIQKKKTLPKFPKGANVKVYEINFKTFLFPLIIGIAAFILFYGIRNYLIGESITYNDTI